MSTNKRRNLKFSVVFIVVSFVAAHLVTWLLADILSSWDSRFVDQLFLFRSQSNYFRPGYDDTVIHVDLNNTSILNLNQFYLNRMHHARVIANLSKMKTAALLYDFIFAAPSTEEEDRALIEATSEAGNVYFGLAFEFEQAVKTKKETAQPDDVQQYLEKTKWEATVTDDPKHFYRGIDPLITFPALASVSRGMGFLNLTADPDGVFRRVPLLVRYKDVFYPSLPFRVICDYLGVNQNKIVINPGNSVILKDIQKPGELKIRDVVIPIDRYGNMIINFTGPWELMKHYNFSDVLKAADDRDDLELWTEALENKIVVVSEVTTGSADIGPVPTDSNYPLSGVNANIIHTILTESFLKVPSVLTMVFMELLLMAIVMGLTLRPTRYFFSFGTLAVAFGYLLLTSSMFLYGNIILKVVEPLLMITVAFISIQIFRAIENARTLKETEKAKNIAEHELEIGRQIQSGFFPEELPIFPDWELAAHFKPARQVAGDFYDAFPLMGGKRIGFVIADVCDKGVGAALFMALIRSLLRAFAVQNFNDAQSEESLQDYFVEGALQRTITLTNNYIAETHGRANMFATIFLGVLDTETGWLNYINGGHEPPIVTDHNGHSKLLVPTGAAVGMLPDIEFDSRKILINPGDILFAFTDGVTEAQNPSGSFFSKQRLLSILSRNTASAEALINTICTEVYDHILTAEQHDDVTMIAIQRKK